MSTVDNSFHLQEIPGIRPIYSLPDDPFIHEVLIPGFTAASNADCIVGFFTSEALVTLAPGLASFINHSDGRFRLIISDVLRSEDWDAIEAAVRPIDSLVDSLLSKMTVTTDVIQRFTLECLSWLIRQGRIEIRIALLRDGIFHQKVWLFHDGNDATLTAHGSSILTRSGIVRNIGQMAVSRSWEDSNELYITQRLTDQFRTLWDLSDKNCIVVPLPEVVRDRLVKYNLFRP